MNKKELTFFHALLHVANAGPSSWRLLDACDGPRGATGSRQKREMEEKTPGEANSLASCWLVLSVLAEVNPEGDGRWRPGRAARPGRWQRRLYGGGKGASRRWEMQAGQSKWFVHRRRRWCCCFVVVVVRSLALLLFAVLGCEQSEPKATEPRSPPPQVKMAQQHRTNYSGFLHIPK